MRFWGILAGTVAGVAALLVAIIVTVGPANRGVTGFTPIERRELFPGLDARLNTVRAIEIKSSDQPLVFEKANGEWRLPQQHEHPVRDGKIETLLQALVSLRADYVSEESSGVSGVANPGALSSAAVRVRLFSSQKELIAGAIIGHELTVPVDGGQARMLVRREQGNRAWLASPVVRIDTIPRAWLKREILDVPRDRVTGLVVIPSEGERVALRRSDKRGLHVVEGIAGDDLAGEPALEATAGALERLQFDDVRPVQAISDRTRPDGRTVVATADGLRYTIRWLADESRTWATIAAEGAASQTDQPAQHAARFNARHAAWAYRLPAHVARYLRVSAADLSHLQRADPSAARGTGKAQ